MQRYLRQLIFCLAVFMMAGILFVFNACDAKAYAYNAEWTSVIKSYVSQAGFGTISWTEVPAASSTITVQVRAGDTAAPDGTWSAWATTTNGQSLSSLGTKKNIQSKVIFDFDGPSTVPTVNDITITSYSGELISSIYDTNNYGNKVVSLSWHEQIAGSSNVLFQMRTSPDKTTWTSWCGPDNGGAGCNSAAYFTDPNGGETIDADFATSSLTTNGTSDRYIQYRLYLFNDGTNIPAVDDVTISYDRQATVNDWTSAVKDTGQNSTFGQLSWTEATSSETTVTVDVRAGATSTPDGTWTNWTAITNGQSLSVFSGNRYIQYRINFSCYDPSYVPTILDVTIPFTYYQAGSHKIISSPYNTSDAANLLATIQWTETAATGTNVRFQIRTAPDNGSGAPDWASSTGWCGPTSCASSTLDTDYASTSYETVPAGETTNAVHQDSSNDQWIQYIVWLETSTTADTPKLFDVTLTYVVNAMPEVQNGISATQNNNSSDPNFGKVIVDYQVRDPDTSTGMPAHQGKVKIDLQYCTANCSATGTESWATAATSTLVGDFGSNVAVNMDGTTWTSHQLVWNAKADYTAHYNGADFKIRVKVDDQEGANNVVYGESNVFVFDTVNPSANTQTTLKIDGRGTNNQVKIYINALDDTNIYYRYSLSSSTVSGLLQSDGINPDSGQWVMDNSIKIATGTEKAIILDPNLFTGASSTKQAAVYIQYSDQYNNINPTVYSVATPERPTGMMIQDITNTNVDPPELGLFISWKTTAMVQGGQPGQFASYMVQRAEVDNPNPPNEMPADNAFQPTVTVSDKLTNYYRDSNLAFSTTTNQNYYYRVYVTDGAGNISYYSTTADSDNAVLHGIPNGTQDVFEGGGGQSAVGPLISNVAVTASTTQSATIQWDTDKLSDSRVDYGVDSGNLSQSKSVSSMADNDTSIGRHKVVITGLSPDTHYYYRVNSTDATGNLSIDNNGGAYFEFSTKPGPAIIPPPTVNNISNATAEVSWHTPDIDSNSTVVYSLYQDMHSSFTAQGSNDLVRDHSVSLSNLSQGTVYYYYVQSADIDNNMAIDDNGGLYYYFITTNDITAPVISGVFSGPVTKTSAIIMWTTDERATSSVEYGTAHGVYATSSSVNPNLNIDQTAELDNLDPGTAYYYRVLSADANGNLAVSGEYSFTTDDFHLSYITIENISATSVDIVWTTDDLAESQVEYSVNSDLSASFIYPAIPTTASTTQLINLSDLNQSAIYYYRASSTFAGQTALSPVYQFTTGDETAPVISSTTAGSISDTEATINWTTDEPANSEVYFGTQSDDYSTSTVFSPSLDITHAQALSGLSPSTLYYYIVVSSDGNSNTATSSEGSFTTRENLLTRTEAQTQIDAARLAEQKNQTGGGIIFIDKSDKTAPDISDVNVSGISSDSAVVSWNTNKNAVGFVEHGSDYSYGRTLGNFDSIMSHAITLDSLSPSTVYHFRVISMDSSGNTSKSSDQMFTTISFEEQMNSISTSTDSSEQDKQSIFDLAANNIRKAMSVFSELASQVSLNALQTTLNSFTEFSNFIPPPIMSGAPTMEITSNSATISWLTDKETNSLVAISSAENYNSQNLNSYAQIIGLPNDKTTKHKVSVLDLSPDTAYHYQLRSKALIGPEAKSKDFTFTTKKEQLEITDYNTKTINSETVTFKWTTNAETDSAIEYIPYRNNILAVDEKMMKQDATYTSIHEITIKDFAPGMVYQVRLSGQDQKGDTVDKLIQTYSTGEDKLPPQINQVQTDQALSTGKELKVQTVISWNTDEPATSRVYFQKGFVASTTDLQEKSSFDTNYTKKHGIVITKFEPGSIYTFRVESADSSGNTALSKLFTVLTPRQKESVFQIILKNFESIFGWMNQM